MERTTEIRTPFHNTSLVLNGGDKIQYNYIHPITRCGSGPMRIGLALFPYGISLDLSSKSTIRDSTISHYCVLMVPFDLQLNSITSTGYTYRPDVSQHSWYSKSCFWQDNRGFWQYLPLSRIWTVCNMDIDHRRGAIDYGIKGKLILLQNYQQANSDNIQCWFQLRPIYGKWWRICHSVNHSWLRPLSTSLFLKSDSHRFSISLENIFKNSTSHV